jgi:hypothetical protein
MRSPNLTYLYDADVSQATIEQTMSHSSVNTGANEGINASAYHISYSMRARARAHPPTTLLTVSD